MTKHKLPQVPEFPKYDPEPIKACHYVHPVGQDKPPEVTVTATPDGGMTIDFEPAKGTAGTAGHVKYGVPKEDIPAPIVSVPHLEGLVKLREKELLEADSLVMHALKSIPGLSPFDIVLHRQSTSNSNFSSSYKMWLEFRPVDELIEVAKHRERVAAAIEKAMRDIKAPSPHDEAPHTCTTCHGAAYAALKETK